MNARLRDSARRTTRRQVVQSGGAVAVVAASATAAGCAQGGGSQESAAPAIGQRDVTLQFMYAGEPTVPEGHKAMVEPFAQRYPRVKIEHVHNPAQYVDKIVNLMVGGTPPDVFWGGGSDMIDFADRGMPLPLKDLMKRDKLNTSELYPASVSHYEWKGEQYGLPRDWAARILFYNVDAFKKAGIPRPAATWKDLSWTWNAFLEASRKLTVRSGDTVSQYGADVIGGFRSWNAWLYNNGGDTIDTTKMACRFTDGPSVDALQFMQDAIHRHQVAIPRDVLQKEGARNAFMNGRVIIQEGTYGYMLQYKNIQLFEWDVAYMPINHRKEGSVGGGGVCWMAAKAGNNIEESWALLKHLISFDAQLIMSRIGGGSSCVRRVMTHPDVSRQRPPEHFNIFVEAGDHVKIDPQVLRWSQINGVIGQQVNDLYDGKRTAKDIAASICQGIEPYLAEQRK
jgi:multiple sugar transport system substrate-binding protein